MTLLKFIHDTISQPLATSPKLNKTLVLDENIQWLTERHFPVTRQPAEGAKGTSKNLQSMLCPKHQNKERSTSKDCSHLQNISIWAWISYWWLFWDLSHCFRLLTVNVVTFFNVCVLLVTNVYNIYKSCQPRNASKKFSQHFLTKTYQ